MSLNAADFSMVGAYSEDGNAAGFAEFGNVFDVAIQHHPADAGGGRGASHLRQRGSAHGFENDSVRLRVGSRLNDIQNLLTLGDGIIVSVDDLNIDAEASGGCFSVRSLLDLIVVVVGRQRNQKLKLFH